MSRPTAGAAALGILVASIACLITGVVLHSLSGEPFLGDDLIFVVVFLGSLTAVGVVGAVLAGRLPSNPLGWLLLTVYALAGLLILSSVYATVALATAAGWRGGMLAAWLANWMWFPMIGLLFVYVPLLFPTGRPPSHRWRVVGWAGGLGIAAVTVNSALAETLSDEGYVVANPIGISGLAAEQGPLDAIGNGLVLAAVVGAVVSVVVRFHRARSVERQQLKWMVFAVALLALVPILEFLPPLPDTIGELLFAMLVGFLPVAIGIAVLRYRLYEIDRIISRTVTYGVVAGLLAAVFASIAIGLPQLLSLPGESPLLVAASTLTVAALFNPLRRRVQVLVDRRFNRARYDAQRTVERFASRLQDELHLDELRTELVSVVHHSVEPAAVSLWLREEARP